MKILRIFGVVVAVHVFAFILIFANPGCSTKPQTAAAAPSGEPAVAAASPSITVPATGSSEPPPITVAPPGTGAFDPNAPAVAPIRYSPTRHNTAAAVALQAEPVKDVIPASAITVGKGDSLWSIANKNHISVGDLAAANNLKTSAVLRPGQKLIVPSKSGTAASAAATPAAESASAAPSAQAKSAAPVPKATPANASGAVKYTVKPGETLGVIARKFGVKSGVIAEANNITNPAMIRAGQELVIPGWQAPKSSKPAPEAPPAATPPPVIPTAPETSPAAGAAPAPANVPVIRVEDAAPMTPPKS